MTNQRIKTKELILGRIILFLSIFILINPVVLYLLLDRLLISIFSPLVLVFVTIKLIDNKKLKPIGVLFFNLILILSFFIHAEVIFTYKFSDYIIDDLYVVKQKFYFNSPYLNKTFQDKEFFVQYKTNKQGLRIGVEDDAEIEIKEVDWIFIGDSYTQGAQVQYEELFTSKLYDQFPDKIIINAGISGQGLPDEYNYFIKDGKKFKPKKVFLQVCNFNDFMNVKERKSDFSDYLMHYSNFARFILYGFKYANPTELPLGRWTEPFYPDEKSNQDYNIFYNKSSEIKKQDLKSFEIYLKKINNAVKKTGAELVVFQIPTKEQVYYKYFDEVVTSFNIDVTNLDMYFPNRLLHKFCEENDIKHIDLLNEFTDSEVELFFQFDEHLNIIGHQQIANSLSKFLRKEEENNSNVTFLSTLNVGDRYPNFSIYNSNLLLYQSFKDGNMELFLGDSLLQNNKRITWNKVDEIHPWISPDTRKLVFTEGNQAENKTKVIIMNADGSERRYITSEINVFGAIPSFSLDGLKIAYAEWMLDSVSGCLTNPYIVTFDLKTNSKDIVSTDSIESWRPIFSPDNKKIYYISNVYNNQFDLIEYNITNKLKRNITNTDFDEWDPSISRDGKLLVYSAKKDGNWDLFLFNLEDGSIKQLTKSLGNEWDPTFSPCGQYVYFSGTFGLHNGIFRLKL